MRRVASLFGAPVQGVLIAAGFMTEEENRPLSPTRTSLQQLSTRQILDEIRRRAAGDVGGPTYSGACERSSSYSGWPPELRLGAQPGEPNLSYSSQTRPRRLTSDAYRSAT